MFQCLNNASTILINGADRLRASQNDLGRGRQNPDFHIELLRLRQNWRLKKIGNNIIGDLSYRSAGSQFKHVSGVIRELFIFVFSTLFSISNNLISLQSVIFI